MSSESHPVQDTSSDKEEEWEKLPEDLLAEQRKHNEKEWEANGVVPLVGINVTDATKNNAKRTYTKERAERNFNVVSGCIQRYTMTGFSIFTDKSTYKELEKDLARISHAMLRKFPNSHCLIEKQKLNNPRQKGQ